MHQLAADNFALLLKAGAFDDALDILDAEDGLLEKGAGHKYIRRIPIAGAAKGGRKYRYIYSAAHALTDLSSDGPQVGEKVRIHDDGKEGHYEVTQRHDDGHVTVKHDETGKELRIHGGKLREMMEGQHGEQAKKEREAAQKAYSIMLEHGSEKQKQRALETLKRRDPQWSFTKRQIEDGLHAKTIPDEIKNAGAKRSEASRAKFAAEADYDQKQQKAWMASTAHDKLIQDMNRGAVRRSPAEKLRSAQKAHTAHMEAGKAARAAGKEDDARGHEAKARSFLPDNIDQARKMMEGGFGRQSKKKPKGMLETMKDRLTGKEPPAEGQRTLAQAQAAEKEAGKAAPGAPKDSFMDALALNDAVDKKIGGRGKYESKADYQKRFDAAHAEMKAAAKAPEEKHPLLGKKVRISAGKHKGKTGIATQDSSGTSFEVPRMLVHFSDDIHDRAWVLPHQLESADKPAKEKLTKEQKAARQEAFAQAHKEYIEHANRAMSLNPNENRAEDHRKAAAAAEKMLPLALPKHHELDPSMKDRAAYHRQKAEEADSPKGKAEEKLRKLTQQSYGIDDDGGTERAETARKVAAHYREMDKVAKEAGLDDSRSAGFGAVADAQEKLATQRQISEDAWESSKKADKSDNVEDHRAAAAAHTRAAEIWSGKTRGNNHEMRAAVHAREADKIEAAQKAKKQTAAAEEQAKTAAPKKKAELTKLKNMSPEEHLAAMDDPKTSDQDKEIHHSLRQAKILGGEYGQKFVDHAAKVGGPQFNVAEHLDKQKKKAAKEAKAKAKPKITFNPIATKPKDNGEVFDHKRPSAEVEFDAAGGEEDTVDDVKKIKHPESISGPDDPAFKDWSARDHLSAMDKFIDANGDHMTEADQNYFSHLADMHEAIADQKKGQEKNALPEQKERAKYAAARAQEKFSNAMAAHAGAEKEAQGPVKRADMVEGALNELPKGTTFTTEEGHVYRHAGNGDLDLIHDATPGLEVRRRKRFTDATDPRETAHVDDLSVMDLNKIRVREPKDTRTIDMFAGKSAYDEAMTLTKAATQLLEKGFGDSDDKSDEGEPMRKSENEQTEEPVVEKAQPKTVFFAADIHEHLERSAGPPAPRGVYDALGSGEVAGQEGRPRFAGIRGQSSIFIPAVDGKPSVVVQRPRQMGSTVEMAKSAVVEALKDGYRQQLMAHADSDRLGQRLSKSEHTGARPNVPAHLLKEVSRGDVDRNAVVEHAAASLKAQAKRDVQLADGLSRLRVSPRTLAETYDALALTPTQVLAGF